MRHRSASKAALLCVAAVALSAACGVIPGSPEPLPSNYIPAAPTAGNLDSGNLSPDGFSAAQRMTVRVRNVGCNDLRTGTGFAIDTHTLVTNKHVIEDTKRLEVTTYDGKVISVTAASVTAAADLAIVTVEEGLGAFSVLASEDPEEGDAISVVGYPKGGILTTVKGVITGTTSDPLGASLGTILTTSAPVEPGSSGSPVLDEEGAVVGVIYAKGEDEESYMIPVSILRSLLDQDSLLVPQPQSC